MVVHLVAELGVKLDRVVLGCWRVREALSNGWTELLAA
jgi:hypothetical protein